MFNGSSFIIHLLCNKLRLRFIPVFFLNILDRGVRSVPCQYILGISPC